MADLMSREIRIWSPMKPGQPYLAQFKGLGFSFYGDTAMAAKRKAEEWREVEQLKLTHGPRKAAAILDKRKEAAA